MITFNLIAQLRYWIYFTYILDMWTFLNMWQHFLEKFPQKSLLKYWVLVVDFEYYILEFEWKEKLWKSGTPKLSKIFIVIYDIIIIRSTYELVSFKTFKYVAFLLEKYFQH